MSNDMTPEKLVGMYLNGTGRVNAQFTRHMRMVSVEVRNATLALIKERGLKPYEFKLMPKQRKVEPMPQEQQEKPAKITTALIRELLAEVRRERETIVERLKTLEIVDRHYMDKLQAMEVKDSDKIENEPPAVPDLLNYDKAHAHAANNRTEIIRSTNCGCFYCGETYPPSEITKWADNNRTALCSRCGIDSVIGDWSGYLLTKEFLAAMYDRWFDGHIGVGRCDTSTENQSVGPAVSATASAAHSPA